MTIARNDDCSYYPITILCVWILEDDKTFIVDINWKEKILMTVLYFLFWTVHKWINVLIIK